MTRFGPDHERWADSVGSYLLGAMPDDELGGFEAHLSECPACRDEVDRLRVAADALPVSVPLVAPPPELKDRIMTVVEAEAELLASAGPAARPARPERPARERRSWFGWLSRPAVALACALVLLVGGGVIGGLIAGGGEETRTLSAQTAPEGATVDLKIARRGRHPGRDRHAGAARGPRLPGVDAQAGREAGPTSALWTPRADGSADVAVPGSLDGVQSVLVSAEPPGGSPAPTTPRSSSADS